VTCPELVVIDDGNIEYSSQGTLDITFGTVAVHSCTGGYFLSGNGTRICSENGTSVIGEWNTIAPECIGTHDTVCILYIQHAIICMGV